MAGTPVKILVPGNHLMAGLLGQRDELLRQIEAGLPRRPDRRAGQRISVEGPDGAELVVRLFDELILMLESGPGPRPVDSWPAPSTWSARTSARARSCAPRWCGRPGQDGAPEHGGAEALRRRHLAEHHHLRDRARRHGQVVPGRGPGRPGAAVPPGGRIILTRPAVEAGERLGFLPGDLMAKVDPYLRPLYDALYDLLEPEGAQRLLDRGTIEVAPLAFMRGRTLNSSFIILDEAQNTTPEQMKMFLTRIGFGSKCVVTGDVTQIDVPGAARDWSASSRCSAGSTTSRSST